MISATGLDALIAKVDRLEKELDRKIKAIQEKLAELGANEARVRFGDAIYDGTNDVEVSVDWEDENTIVVSATGRSVLFVEFGTGVTYSEPHPKADEFGMVRGGYGQGKGKNSSWTYYGEPGTNGQFVTSGLKGDVYRTSGNPANRCMYEAGQKIREELANAVKEAFKS